MTDALGNVHDELVAQSKDGGSTLFTTLKTTLRLVPRQITDELDLAKLEIKEKKTRLIGVAVVAAVALALLVILVIALVVAAIAGLAVVVPLWLSALIVSAALLVIIAICGLVGYRKFKSLMPLVPEQAWRGIRHDLGIAKEGNDFDAATLIPAELTKAEKKEKKAEAEAEKEKAAAEREAKAAENGPKATQEELIKRTGTRREHLTSLRAELVEQADVKKQTGYLLDVAKEKASQSAHSSAAAAVARGLETAKMRWKPLAVFAMSATTCLVLLRKLLKK